jgi:hypothetical protein
MMVIYSWSRAPRRWPSASKYFYLSKGGTSPAISLPSNDANATFKRIESSRCPTTRSPRRSGFSIAPPTAALREPVLQHWRR